MKITFFSIACHPFRAVLIGIVMMIASIPGKPAAEEGVTQNTILLGQTCALSGPAMDLGLHMKAGINAAFKQYNSGELIKGRRIRLLSMDDYYEPGQAIKNTRHLIENEIVFAIIGAVGTPTSMAAAPIADSAGVPFLAPYTGARFLRQPFQKNIINIRAGYDEETRKIAAFFIETRKFSRIACFYQNDSFGLAGLAGIEAALAEYGLDLVAKDSYQRNTVAVMGGFLRIRNSHPEAVLLAGAYQPTAEFIKLGRAKGMKDVVYCSLSFAGSQSLKNALGHAAQDVIISQVVPSPDISDLEITREYRRAMADFQPDHSISYISFEGYIAGRFFIQAVRSVSSNLTRKSFIEAIESAGTFDLGGLTLTFGPGDHQGLDTIFLTTIQNGQIIPIGD